MTSGHTDFETLHLFFQRIEELLITRQLLKPVLNQVAQSPQSKGRLAISFNNIQMRPVWPQAHLTCLGYDSIDALRERVLQ